LNQDLPIFDGCGFNWRLKYYKHGTELNFNFDKVYLLKYKEPVINEIVAPCYVDISQKWISLDLDGYGFEGAKGKGYKIQAEINDQDGKKLVSTEISLDNGPGIIMDISEIKEVGPCQINVDILDKNGEKVDSMHEEILVVSGYL
jgi:hypothetical protein